jgi:hypothetical protein
VSLGWLVVPGDAAATATNILAQASLLRLGFASYLVEMACLIAATALFYDLLKPVSRSVSLLAAFFSLVGIAIKPLSRLFYIAPLLLLRVNAQGAGIAMVFFGCYALLKGYLIFRPTFLPRILGVLGMLAGVGWLTFLTPRLATRAYPYVVTIALLGTAAQIVWLLVYGVNEQRWKEQAGRAAESIWA